MVGVAGVEPTTSPKEIWGYSPVPLADIDLTPISLAESLGVEPSRVLSLGALAVRWLAVCLALLMNLAGVAGVEPALAVLEAATVTVRSPLKSVAERRGLEPRRPEGPSAFEAASARPKLGLPLRISRN